MSKTYQRQKGSIYQEEIITKNIYTKRQSPKIYEANTDRNERRNVPTIRVGEFNTPLSIMNKISRKKIHKDIEDCQYKSPKLNIYI